jgi:hypothetical protein
MKTWAIVIGSVALAVVLVAVGFLAGAVWSQSRWGYRLMSYDAGSHGYGMMGYTLGYGMMGPGMMDYGPGYGMMDHGPGYGMMGPGMMDHGPGYGMMGPGMMDYGPGYGTMGPWNGTYRAPAQGDADSLDEAVTAIQEYVERLGYTGLEVTEVMEFGRNYYAIVAEEDTGIGAMELLLDKNSGAVGPEPGPNMMWNANYSPMGRSGGMMGMMGSYASDEMTLSPQEAQEVAQRWLDANLPGRTAGDADAFYGYYTLHFLKDGQIDGMLSVHGSSGDVWYHSWHGDFVSMVEGHS